MFCLSCAKVYVDEVVSQISKMLHPEDEFLTYYNNIINQNSRRPALKDEMKKKIG